MKTKILSIALATMAATIAADAAFGREALRMTAAGQETTAQRDLPTPVDCWSAPYIGSASGYCDETDW